MPEYKMCANAEMAIYILEFIQRGYKKHYDDAGVRKYIEALQMGIDALEKQIPKKPETNYDRIQNKTVEEMADFICGVYDMDEDYAKYINGVIIPGYSHHDIKEWLEQEVDYDI